MCIVHWHVVCMCDVFCVCFWLPKPTQRESVESENELVCLRTNIHIRHIAYTHVQHENESIKNVENTEIEYVGGFK